jgi:hypothetical protein
MLLLRLLGHNIFSLSTLYLPSFASLYLLLFRPCISAARVNASMSDMVSYMGVMFRHLRKGEGEWESGRYPKQRKVGSIA